MDLPGFSSLTVVLVSGFDSSSSFFFSFHGVAYVGPLLGCLGGLGSVVAIGFRFFASSAI